MTDTEISSSLALAIGWTHDRMFTRAANGAVMVRNAGNWWKVFDYRDPAVIWPIAEQFDCFPRLLSEAAGWFARVTGSRYGERGVTAAQAVALAVIRSKAQP